MLGANEWAVRVLLVSLNHDDQRHRLVGSVNISNACVGMLNGAVASHQISLQLPNLQALAVLVLESSPLTIAFIPSEIFSCFVITNAKHALFPKLRQAVQIVSELGKRTDS